MSENLIDSLFEEFTQDTDPELIEKELRQIVLEPNIPDEVINTITKLLYCYDILDADREIIEIWNNKDLTYPQKFNHWLSLLNSRLEANKEFIHNVVKIFNEAILPALNSKLKAANHLQLRDLDISNILIFTGNEVPLGFVVPVVFNKKSLEPVIAISSQLIRKNSFDSILEILLHEALHFGGFLNNANFHRIGMESAGIKLLHDLLEFATVSWTFKQKQEIKISFKAEGNDSILDGVWDNIFIDGGYADIERTLDKICKLLGINESIILRAGIEQDPLIILSEINRLINKMNDSEYLDFIQGLYLDFRLSLSQRDALISNREINFINIYDLLLEYGKLHHEFLGQRKVTYSKEYLENYFSRIVSLREAATNETDIDKSDMLIDRSVFLSKQLSNILGNSFEDYFDEATGKIKEPMEVAKIVEARLQIQNI